MRISAFCLTTNAIKNEMPFIESIKSWLQIADEIVVVDGGSTDGTIQAIEQLNDKRVKIICDDDTKWEDEWLYSRMGKNFDRGLQECTGDWAFKFDVDYILHEKGVSKIKKECESALENEVATIAFTRLNLVLANSYYVKSKKTLAVNKTLCKNRKINLKYGFDIEKWGWGFDFISAVDQENGIWFGSLIRGLGTIISSAVVFNYDYVFRTEDCAKESRFRHFRAVNKQRNLKYKRHKIKSIVEDHVITKEFAWRTYLRQLSFYLNNRNQFDLEVEGHPKIIQDRIKNININQQGHNCWGMK